MGAREFVAGLALLLLAGCPEEGKENNSLFLDERGPVALEEEGLADVEWVRESRVAKLNDEYFFDKAFSPAIGKPVVFNIFDDLVLTVLAVDYGPVGTGSVIWHGKDVTGAYVRIALAIKGRTVDGEVRTLDEVVRITPVDGLWHRIDRYAAEGFPAEDTPIEVKTLDEGLEAESINFCDKTPGEGDPRPGPGKPTHRIRILVAYTPTVGQPGIQSYVDLIIDQLRDMWDVQPNFIILPELAYLAQVSYTESGSMGTDLTRLSRNGDGFMDEIHGLRDAHRADMVALLISSNEFCGKGYRPFPPSAANSGYGFSVTAIQCALGNLSFAHELGHNLSMHHDRYVVNPEPRNTYYYGYSNRDLSLRTVMAYADECRAYGQTCTRFPSYSHPYLFMKNEKIGQPIGQPNAAHNRNMLCYGANAVSQYR